MTMERASRAKSVGSMCARDGWICRVLCPSRRSDRSRMQRRVESGAWSPARCPSQLVSRSAEISARFFVNDAVAVRDVWVP